MDLIKIGRFLAKLRHERGYTQEKLGEILGVTNKTISRWENGNYLPPVEMLQLLSEHYSVSINEILSGERLRQEDFREKAEENLRLALQESAFSLMEKIKFFRRKWLRENFVLIIICTAVFVLLFAAGVVMNNGLQAAAIIFGIASYFRLYNRMMIYIEKRAYDGKITNSPE